jgi:RNA polymerase sigma factor (TIGR02999 family)
MNDVTRIIAEIGQGKAEAADALLELVYDELRKLAAHRMAGEAPGQTLQPTALVHEAWLRLTGNPGTKWDGRAHFFAAAAEAMRRILVDVARRKHARKHGAGFQRVELDEAAGLTDGDGSTLLLVNDALEMLAREDAVAAEVVKLRFFVGLTNEEAAAAMGLSERTVKRHWTFARAWLYHQIARSDASG